MQINKDGYLEIEYKEVEFSEEELEKIKITFEEKENIQDEDLEKLKQLKIKSGTDSITLGQLFMTCYNYLNGYLYLLSDKDDKEKSKLEKKLNDYLSNFQVENLRILIEEYNDGVEFGSYYIGERIKDLANAQRTKLNKLIELFFKVFGED